MCKMKLSTLIVVFLCCLMGCRALVCWTCDTNRGQKCSGTSMFKKTCSSTEVCWSNSFIQQGKVYQVKDCRYKNGNIVANCEIINNLLGGSCYICETDLCNAPW